MDQRPSSPAGIGLLMMDFQNAIVDLVPEPRRQTAMTNAADLLPRARAAQVPVFHVTVSFREGYPEVHPANMGFSRLKSAGLLLEGSPGAAIHASLAPLRGEPIVVKRRVSAFGTTDLHTLLGARGIRTLVLAGLFTSGVVLSTVRAAADLDYDIVVVEDACGDPDEEVHRVLTGKVFSGQTRVVPVSGIDTILSSR
ncbi:MAG: cysteine hydrolase family protein [Lautropia sp.]